MIKKWKEKQILFFSSKNTSKLTLKHSFQPFFQFQRGKTKQKTSGSGWKKNVKKKCFFFQQLIFFCFFSTIEVIFSTVKILIDFFQLLKLFFQQLMFFLVFFQQLKVWTMEESQVEAVCELRWVITSANFQGVETSPAVLFKPTNCLNCKCSLSPPPCVLQLHWDLRREVRRTQAERIFSF